MVLHDLPLSAGGRQASNRTPFSGRRRPTPRVPAATIRRLDWQSTDPVFARATLRSPSPIGSFMPARWAAPAGRPRANRSRTVRPGGAPTPIPAPSRPVEKERVRPKPLRSQGTRYRRSSRLRNWSFRRVDRKYCRASDAPTCSWRALIGGDSPWGMECLPVSRPVSRLAQLNVGLVCSGSKCSREGDVPTFRQSPVPRPTMALR